MEPAGVLRVRTSSRVRNGTEKSICVEVIDTGHGIAPEHMGRIYDPFFTTKGVKKGTGLGLSVTYGIIQEHGGAIEAISKPGEGTCFRLELPVVRKAVQV
jgi:signal transduction histidine kinase